MTTKFSDFKAVLLADPEVRAIYDELGPEYEIARAVIKARIAAGLTQEQMAQRMGTTQPVIARLESGRAKPSMSTLLRVAKATGTRPRFELEPAA
jgi:ribosome-binding protein aMBF1 (putative translation factor)